MVASKMTSFKENVKQTKIESRNNEISQYAFTTSKFRLWRQPNKSTMRFNNNNSILKSSTQKKKNIVCTFKGKNIKYEDVNFCIPRCIFTCLDLFYADAVR